MSTAHRLRLTLDSSYRDRLTPLASSPTLFGQSSCESLLYRFARPDAPPRRPWRLLSLQPALAPARLYDRALELLLLGTCIASLLMAEADSTPSTPRLAAAHQPRPTPPTTATDLDALLAIQDFCIIGGGTGCNAVVGAFAGAKRISYCLPVSDDGGSSSEIQRVLGQPSALLRTQRESPHTDSRKLCTRRRSSTRRPPFPPRPFDPAFSRQLAAGLHPPATRVPPPRRSHRVPLGRQTRVGRHCRRDAPALARESERTAFSARSCRSLRARSRR